MVWPATLPDAAGASFPNVACAVIRCLSLALSALARLPTWTRAWPVDVFFLQAKLPALGELRPVEESTRFRLAFIVPKLLLLEFVWQLLAKLIFALNEPVGLRLLAIELKFDKFGVLAPPCRLG